MFDEGEVHLKAYGGMTLGPGTRTLGLKSVRYRRKDDSTWHEVRPLGNRPLRLKVVASGDVMRGTFHQEFYWIEQPYEILDTNRIVAYSYPSQRDIGKKRPSLEEE